MMKAHFFGCRFGQTGHYWWQEGHNLTVSTMHHLDVLDGLLPPPIGQPQGPTQLVYLNFHGNKVTAVAFWDRSVDSRPNSNGLFLFPGLLTFEQAMKEAKRLFPDVVDRLRVPLHQWKPNEEIR